MGEAILIISRKGFSDTVPNPKPFPKVFRYPVYPCHPFVCIPYTHVILLFVSWVQVVGWRTTGRDMSQKNLFGLDARFGLQNILLATFSVSTVPQSLLDKFQ